MITRCPAFALSVLLAALTTTLAGCGADAWRADPDSPADDQWGGGGPISAPVYGPSPDGPRPGPRPYSTIPDDAQPMETGTGEFRFIAPEDGRVWVGNDARRFLVVAANVKRGDELQVIPRRDRVRLEDRDIYASNMESRDPHTVFFRPATTDWRGRTIKPYGGIPSSARHVAGGEGIVTFQADVDGTVYVGNDRTKAMITTVAVRAGQVVEVDAKNDQVKLNGKVVYNRNLESKHAHSIFFK
ncbi:MAG: hypothetical protein ACK51N_01215 [bacterium]|jgi:hypothetical protein|nr:hypothetical protein [Phycisphaerales bacterium]MCE2652244.1 hypothetical protein [Planctomycetaceae bacterium]